MTLNKGWHVKKRGNSYYVEKGKGIKGEKHY
jgi:hypothetical protein